MDQDIKTLLQMNEARLKTENLHNVVLYYFKLLNEQNATRILPVLVMMYLQFGFLDPKTAGLEYKIGEWLDKAIKLKPDCADLYIARARLMSVGIDVPNYLQAANDYKEALKLQPYMIEAGLGLAGLVGVPENVVYVRDVIELLESISIIHPQDPFTHFALGQLYEKSGVSLKSVEAFENALLCVNPLPTEYARVVTRIVRRMG
jgi:tetratricopeptide (TPR) repeat protein